VLSQLDGQVAAAAAADAGLIVSELVSNSVLHANVGAQEVLTVELVTLGDRLRIVVIDPGSDRRPRMLPPDPDRAGGFGLVVVDELCEAWGVGHDGVGPTSVWCELLLDRSPPGNHAPHDAG
jgi:anti-sigma regulatory factor (Ser/Thr protein kinase)